MTIQIQMVLCCWLGVIQLVLPAAPKDFQRKVWGDEAQPVVVTMQWKDWSNRAMCVTLVLTPVVLQRCGKCCTFTRWLNI